MKFGEPVLDNIIDNYFRRAVTDTGFQLFRLDDKPEAGLIDARLRNEIRNCRFLIADLSHANAGSYWEAGYAEGLGKPVIYTCEKSVFDGDSKTARPHFDANHHLTVVWEVGNPQFAASRLKETIRYTVPEAKQTDQASLLTG
jgi:nucleoside 2-deoxyribosyltransferase